MMSPPSAPLLNPSAPTCFSLSTFSLRPLMIFNRLPRSLNRTALSLRTRYPTVPHLATRLAVRGAASEVSSRPGSQSLPHGELNATGEQLVSDKELAAALNVSLASTVLKMPP